MTRLPEHPHARRVLLEALEAALGFAGGTLTSIDGYARQGYRFCVLDDGMIAVEPPDENGQLAANSVQQVLNRDRFRDGAITAIEALEFVTERE